MAGVPVGGGQVKAEPGNPNAATAAMTAAHAAAGGGPAQRNALTLSTFIYDYFYKRKMYGVAKAMLESDLRTEISVGKKTKAEMNGTNDDSLNDTDLPPAQLNDQALHNNSLQNNSLLDEWWNIFWDMWNASRGGTPNVQGVAAYLNSQQLAKQRQHPNAAFLNPQQQQQMVQQNALRMANGGMDVRRAAMAGNQQSRNSMIRMGQQPGQPGPMGPQQMTRDGSQLDMSGGAGAGDRAQSPMSGTDNAPSPKRPRIDGTFNGPGMNAQARAAGMAQMNGVGPHGAPNMMSNGYDGSNPMAAAGQFPMGGAGAQNGMFARRMPDGSMPKAFGAPNGMQGAAMIGPDGAMVGGEFLGPNGGNQMRANVSNGGNPNQGGGALADYQMQLMLLEQQNKKRLLMARQEQDQVNGSNVNNVMAGQNMMNQPQFPNAGFGGAPNGPMNAQAQAQLEMARQQSGGRPGNFPPGAAGMPAMMGAGGPPGAAPGGAGGPNQQPPNAGGPEGAQRNQMPPPQAPAGVNNQRPPSESPAQNNPPTPLPANKANPKNSKKGGKDGDKKKPAGKKGGTTTGATPSSEAQDPPTPTPATPITPHPANSLHGPKGGQGQPGGPQAPGPPGQQVGPPQGPNGPSQGLGDMQQSGPGGHMDGSNPNQPFGNGGNLHMDHSSQDPVDFSNFVDFDSNEMLQGFDLGSFLELDPDGLGGDFDTTQFGNMNGDGVEMGAGQQ